MEFKIKLQKKDFEKVEKGKKIVELQIADEEFGDLKLGDEIEFMKFPNLRERITVKVTGLFIYKTFGDLVSDLPATHFGYNEGEKEDIIRDIYKINDKEKERKWGVVGIRFELEGDD